MMDYRYASRMATDIGEFIREMVVSGHEERTYHFPLKHLDQLCLERFPDADTVTMEIADAYSKPRAGERDGASINKRMSVLSGFARYQRRIGKDAFNCTGWHLAREDGYLPYLPTDEELSRFFKAIDSLERSSKSDVDHIVAPLLFRMVYCCALRPGEAVRLEKEDVDMEGRILHIRNTKTGRDRLVPFHDDLVPLIEAYRERMGRLEIASGHFFHNACGRRLNEGWLSDHVRKACAKAGLGPRHEAVFRCYDLRHAAASRIVMRWQQEDGNVMGRLPYLMAYMGHVDWDSTLYYVSVVPEQFYGRGIAEIDDVINALDDDEPEEGLEWW